jgi:hypothetical protein
MLRSYLPFPGRVGENIQVLLDRLNLIHGKQLEVRKLELNLNKERQFNRRMELHGKLRRVAEELENLSK